MKHMIHMMTMMGMMDGITGMTPEFPIICSSNHIDDASGLFCPHAKGITFDFTGHKVAKTRILSKWLTQLNHLCCVLSLF